MALDELFERAVSVTKIIWRKRGDQITRHEVQRLIAADAGRWTEVDDAS